MRVAVFDTHSYDREALEAVNRRFEHDLTFLEPRLTHHTARLAAGFPAVCSFVNDRVNAATLGVLQAFLTHEALANIAETTLGNIQAFERGDRLVNEVVAATAISPTPQVRPERLGGH